ncbi:hypothetical protein HXX76_012572 [Chlamydomonas incerta]|uniref:Uncharacterized protein n=1 Tax=Chlamydomonas incerta TaxID=51695 RepID=A0A835SWB4_CHLIN|nr:hypothetical protein HXX76_012572 [Chlamydomonas incerta]|eukprot:KAG2427056.1 hypothetical protein HXX76_012572 [Chlamydomonas incerta]
MLQQEQQVRPDESLSARGNAAGPGQLPRPADSPFGGTGGEARDSSEAQQLQPPEVGNRTVDAGAPCQGRSAAISHLVSLTRQQRKLWASAAFQAQVFDALMGAGLPLKPPPPPSAPPAASISDLQLPSPYPTAEAPGTSAATGSGAGHPASASLPVPAEAPAAAGTAAGAAAHASVAASSQLLSLTAAESDVLRWGRNAAVGSIPKSVSAGTYKKATAVEVLVAHLYLTAPERCAQLIQAAVSLAPLPP